MRHSGITPDDLPHCPRCKTALLRPGVVWFGESLPEDVIDVVETWIDESPNIDLMLVIGTSAQVWPAAGYIAKAKSKGARIAVVNMDTGDLGAGKIVGSHDWVIAGDAAKIVPQILESEIGTEYFHGN
jgi:NAD-dependent SIR2 family protein deacetylase